MYYFAKYDSTGELDSISVSEFKTEQETSNAYYVSESECLRLKQQIAERIEAENKKENEDSVTYEELLEKNASLEAENAALLYQVLTGEEYSDV